MLLGNSTCNIKVIKDYRNNEEIAQKVCIFGKVFKNSAHNPQYSCEEGDQFFSKK